MKELISDEEEEIDLSSVPSQPPPRPSMPAKSSEADLLNWGPQADANKLVSDVNLLDIGSSSRNSGGIVKDPSNFDLLSGIGEEGGSEAAAGGDTSTGQPAPQGNLFDPFDSGVGAQTTSPQNGTQNLFGQFSVPNQTQQGTSLLGGAVS